MSSQKRRLARVLGIGALAGVGLLGGVTASAQAATTTLYAAPADVGAADCSSAANACAITTAVTNANAASVADSVVIEVADGTYALPAPTPTALPITFAGPSLTIEAASGAPTLDGQGLTRLLSVGSTSNVTIDGLRFQSGSTSGLGGAIQNDGVLTVNDSTFSNNTGGNGGAITNTAGGTLTVTNSTFSNNAASSVGGGAIISFATATIVRSALIDNTAPINGGAINVQPNGVVTISSSTISGNTSGSLGGGMSNLGTLTVQGSTIASNSGSGGSAIATGNANVTFAADIIAAQASGDACSPVNSAFTDAGYNLDTDGTCLSADTPADGSHNGTTAYGSSTYGAVLNAYLADGPADNGGPSPTIALRNTADPATDEANPAFNIVPASFDLPAAIDGESAACSLPDQRGVTPVAGSSCAIGAYLLQATATTLAASAPTVVQNTSMTYTATVTGAPSAGTVSFNDGAGNPATANCAAQPVSNGTATCTVSYPNTGSYSATATYSGDGTQNNFAPSAASPASSVTVVAPDVPPPPVTPDLAPVTLSGVAIAPRCLGTGAGASKTLRLSYVLNRAARVTFTLQRRTSPGLVTPRKCPSPLPMGKNTAMYAPAGSGAVDAAGGPSYVTVQQSGAVTRGAHAARRPTRLTRTVAAARGKHRISLLATLRATKALTPGRYRVLVDAVAADGVKSSTATVWFWVLRPPRHR